MPKCFSPLKVKEHECETINTSLEGARNQVYAMEKAGLTQCAIADQICVNKSTISREVKRNTGLRGYRPKQAHRLALQGSHKFPASAFWMRFGLGLKR